MAIECYFDDSYDDYSVAIMTMAGYIGKKESWRRFEADCIPLFDSFGIEVFHAKDFHSSRGEFSNWETSKKLEFLTSWFDLVKSGVDFGINRSVLKDTFDEAKKFGLFKTESTYGYCFNQVLDDLLRDERILHEIENCGATISIKIEQGNKNNKGVLECFGQIREKFSFQDRLSGIEFVAKNSCRAVQVADALAFYSRRHAQESEENDRQPLPQDQYLKIMTERLSHKSRLTTDF
jgi:hypothetical protein